MRLNRVRLPTFRRSGVNEGKERLGELRIRRMRRSWDSINAAQPSCIPCHVPSGNTCLSYLSHFLGFQVIDTRGLLEGRRRVAVRGCVTLKMFANTRGLIALTK